MLEGKIAVAEERITAILATIDNVIWSISATTYETLYLNPAAEKVYGRPVEAFYTNPDLFMCIVFPADRELVSQVIPRLTDKDTVSVRYRIVRPDGDVRWLEDIISGARGADGALVRIDGVAHDITDRLALEHRLNAILATIDNVIWSISAESYETLYLNPAAEKIYGRPAEEFYEDNELFWSIVHPEDRERVAESLSALFGKGSLSIQYRIVRPDGQVRWLEDKVVVGYGPDGRPARIDGVAHDITERKEHEARLQYLATHDALTDLPNRNLLDDRIFQAIAHAQRSESGFALLLLDLDRFKLINDGYGHGYGDALLLTLSERLKEAARESDTVARLGGDEFVVLLSPLRNAEEAIPVVRRIQNVFSAPFHVLDTELYSSGSIGIAVYPGDGKDANALLKNADAAMYRAKQQGRNGFQFFEPEMSAQVVKRLELENALRSALDHGEFVVFYQSQKDINTGQVSGVEALLRWRHPTKGIISPEDFVAVAEDTGLIVPIGNWVLKTACEQNKAWQDAGMPRMRMGVNISARQFWEGQIVPTVRRVLAETGLAPGDLELEVTEAVFLRNIQETVRTIEQLRSLGVAVSMDDFGTGYSSLNYLRSLPIERLKIDGSFVHEMSTVPTTMVMMKQLIQLAHAINLKVVAEGVETEDEFAFLAENQCDLAQGHYFHKPVAAEEFEDMLRGITT